MYIQMHRRKAGKPNLFLPQVLREGPFSPVGADDFQRRLVIVDDACDPADERRRFYQSFKTCHNAHTIFAQYNNGCEGE